MSSEGSEILVADRACESRRNEEEIPKLGEWYWVTSEEYDRETDSNKSVEWLGCVTDVGSNYVEFSSVTRRCMRIHFKVLSESCRLAENVDVYIKEKIALYGDRSRRALREIAELTSRLCIAPKPTLHGNGDNQALALCSGGEPVEDYKRALIEAREKTLPALFDEVKEANQMMATWMKADLLPLMVQVDTLQGSMDLIKDRIFSVELYAGLVEEVEKVRKGKPAEMLEPIRLMQRRHYMDEECLVDYRCGGMEFKDIRAFDKWLGERVTFERIFPFPRCVVAFQVRREDKDRGEIYSLGDYIKFRDLAELDKFTFLYFRNGEQLFRFRTKVEFDEKLFPDLEHREIGFTGAKLWARVVFSYGSVDYKDIITDDRYQAILEDERLYEIACKEKKPEKRQTHVSEPYPRSRDYRVFSPENVHFDDIARAIGDQAAKHNRLVLILQGLLDRSPVFHPHPVWQLWTSEGFASGLRLVYDNSRALVAGEKPDFEAYRARLNKSLMRGAITIGQEDAWELHEGAKETVRRQNSWRYRSGDDVKRFTPYGNPGPGKLAKVIRCGGDGRCTYEWMRERLKRKRWGENSDSLRSTFTCSSSAVLNVSVYRPGDYKQFYDDPRTRAEYLKWAPLLLEAEEYYAGNRSSVDDDGDKEDK